MLEPRPYSFDRWHPGLGQSVGQPPGAVSTTATEVGSGLLSASGAVTLANPLAGGIVAAAGGIADLVGAVAKMFQGCGPTCTQATQIVNQVEPYLQLNNQTYFTNPNRTTGDQQNAIATAQQIFAMVQQQCGSPQLGTAGQNCISARLGNGITTQSSPNCAAYTSANEYPPYCSVPYPPGVCWTWTLAYLDPIVNDIPPGGEGDATVTSVDTSPISSANYLPLIIIAALALGVMLL